MGAKLDRLSTIRQIVSSRRISDQGELIEALKEMGIQTTQATLSRDLRAMNIVKKVDSDGVPRYAFSEPPRSMHYLYGNQDPGILSVEVSDPFAVIKTNPGYAAMVASRIDAAALAGMMGTIAGDDTVLVIMRKGAGSPIPSLETVFPGIESKEI